MLNLINDNSYTSTRLYLNHFLMSLVNVTNVQVLGKNPSSFKSSFEFEITFECISHLEQDLEWKIIYVGSAESERYDQVLDCIMVGPVPIGINKFIFQADPPNPNLIPPTEVAGITIILLICSYLDQEFVRVGYYVDNSYEDPELRQNPPNPPLIDLLRRSILADKARVTKFDIKWDSTKMDEVPQDILNVQVDESELEDSQDESESTESDSECEIDASSEVNSIDEDMSEEFMNDDCSSSTMADVDQVPSDAISIQTSHQVYLESNESIKLMSSCDSVMNL